MAVTSNPKVRGISLMLVVALAVLCTAPTAKTTHLDADKEYVLMVRGEELRFVARPELGYVVKTRQDAASIEALSRILKGVGSVDISPIGGLGRKGVRVVYSERPAAENEKTVNLLRLRKEVQYAAPLFSSNGETVAIIPEIVVRVKPHTQIEALQMLCEAAGCTINKRMEFTEQEYLLEVFGPDAEAVLTAVEQLGQAPCIEWACPNTAFRPKLCGQAVPHARDSGEKLRADAPEQDANAPGIFPNDEYFPLQWYLHNTGQDGATPGVDINAPEAWEITTGDPNVVIAVIDCGVDSSHPDLIDNLVPGYDFFEGDTKSDPARQDRHDAHGTACAGTAAAKGNNGIGVAGVAYDCKIMSVRHNNATKYISWANEATALRWTAAHGADVISCSWGGRMAMLCFTRPSRT